MTMGGPAALNCKNNFLISTMSVALLAISSYATLFWPSFNTVLL